MIKISILYPNKPDARFDHAYYRDKHMPMVAGLMGDLVKGWGVDQGLSGGAPGVPAPYIAIGYLLFDSIQAFQEAFRPHGKAIGADLPNYTDVTPVTQISEVLAA